MAKSNLVRNHILQNYSSLCLPACSKVTWPSYLRTRASIVVRVPDRTVARECSQDNAACDHKHGCFIDVCQLSRGARHVYLNRLLTARYFISFVATWGLSHTSSGKWNGVRIARRSGLYLPISSCRQVLREGML